MFNEQRYLTRGVQATLSIPLQITLWRMIEKIETDVDYFQIFILEQLPNNQIKVTHKQEEPEYQSVKIVHGKINTSKLKIYVIDDHDYSTMLCSDEY